MYSFGTFASKTASNLRKHMTPVLAQVAFDTTRHHYFHTTPHSEFQWSKPSTSQPLSSTRHNSPVSYLDTTHYQHPSCLNSKNSAALSCWGLPEQLSDMTAIPLNEDGPQPASQRKPGLVQRSLATRILRFPSSYCDQSAEQESTAASTEDLSLSEAIVFGFEKKGLFIEPSFIPSLAENIQYHCGVPVLIEKPQEILTPYFSVSTPHSGLVQINLEPLSAEHAKYDEAIKLQKDMTLITLSALPEPVIIEVDMRFQTQQDARELLILLREIAVSRDNVELKFKKCSVCGDKAVDSLMDKLSGVEHHANIVFLDKFIEEELGSTQKRPWRKLGAL